MAAANTDKLRKKKSNFSTTLNGSINDSATTIALNSASGLPTDTAVTLTIDRVDANGVSTPSLKERVTGVVSSNNLTNCLRGEDSSTAQSHNSGAVVEDIWEADSWNDHIDQHLVEHNQDGTHSKVTGMTNNTAVTQKDSGGTARAIAKLNSNNVLELGVAGASALNDAYLVDSGSANAYAVTATPAPAAYAAGMHIRMKAANDNTAASTVNVNSLGTKNIKMLDGSDPGAGAIQGGGIHDLIYDGTQFILLNPYVAASSLDFSTLNAPQGFLINGKIVTSVSSNNITVAIKGLDGNDPSSTNKVYIRIGNTVRTLTAALSVTKNAGTNWFNSGSTELAAQEVDYFVYLGYNATDGIVIGFARIPYARSYGDFSTTTTNQRYCAISTITNASSTDEYENIGRFNAILSATASFNWSIPATSIIINKPILFSRNLVVLAQTTSTSGTITAVTVTAQYQVRDRMCWFAVINSVTNNGTGSGSLNITAPFTVVTASRFYLYGRDHTTGDMLYAQGETTGFQARKYNNAYPSSGALEGQYPIE